MNRGGLLQRVLIKAVRGYQLVVSPWFAPTCRYYPSCSRYAIDALSTHGAVKGLVMSAWRLLRCNPWSRGGVDVVPAQWPAGKHGVAGDEHGSIQNLSIGRITRATTCQPMHPHTAA